MRDWAPIRGFGGEYEVSRDGKVRNVLTGKRLRPCPSRTRQNRLRVSLYRYGERRSFWVARLVLAAHVGPPPFPGAEGDHGDFNTQNNNVENLSWATHQANCYRSLYAGRMARKLNADIVRQIRYEDAQYGPSAEYFAEMFGVHVRTIQKIIKGDLWAWAGC